MPPVIKNLFLSKKWLTAFLTVVAATAAYFGTNLNVTAILVFISPLLTFIGAQGWADAGKEKALIEQQTEKMRIDAGLKMHEMSLAARADTLIASKQAGFARIGLLFTVVTVMLVVITTISLVSTTTSCGPSTGAVVTDVIDCAKAEATAVASGSSIIEVVQTVLRVVAGSPLPGCEQSQNILECDVEKLVLKFGEDIVACTIDSIPEPGAGSGSALPQATLLVAHKHEAMKRFAGKKIVHRYANGSN